MDEAGEGDDGVNVEEGVKIDVDWDVDASIFPFPLAVVVDDSEPESSLL